MKKVFFSMVITALMMLAPAQAQSLDSQAGSVAGSAIIAVNVGPNSIRCEDARRHIDIDQAVRYCRG